jgi:hypothetical protein
MGAVRSLLTSAASMTTIPVAPITGRQLTKRHPAHVTSTPAPYCPTLYLALASPFVLPAILVPAAANDPAVTAAKAEFEDVLGNLKSAIAGRGINIAHILPASEMLNRTAGALNNAVTIMTRVRTLMVPRSFPGGLDETLG